MQKEKKGRGGIRSGAGRPKSNAPKRIRRAVEYFDEEWDMIKRGADAHAMSIREYIYRLVEQDQFGV